MWWGGMRLKDRDFFGSGDFIYKDHSIVSLNRPWPVQVPSNHPEQDEAQE